MATIGATPVIAAPQPMPVEAKKPVKKAKAPKAASGIKKAKPTHPAWAEMITNAVKALNEKGGSSISAIKKYMMANYKIEAEKATPFMRRGIKAALTNGSLIQAKGKGLTGSFKLSKTKVAGAVKTKKIVKKTTSTGEKLKTKKMASPKKTGVKKITKKSKTAGAATPKKAKIASPAKKATAAKKPVAAKAKPAAKKALSASKPKPKVIKKAASPKKATGMKPKTAKAFKSPKVPKPKTAKKAAPKKAAASSTTTTVAAPSAK